MCFFFFCHVEFMGTWITFQWFDHIGIPITLGIHIVGESGFLNLCEFFLSIIHIDIYLDRHIPLGRRFVSQQTPTDIERFEANWFRWRISRPLFLGASGWSWESWQISCGNVAGVHWLLHQSHPFAASERAGWVPACQVSGWRVWGKVAEVKQIHVFYS